MKKAFLFFVSILLLAGCFTYLKEYPQNLNQLSKTYAHSTPELKAKLLGDLRGGRLKLGESMDAIRTAYGDPDNMFVFEYMARLVYKLDQNKNVLLWFEDGMHLSMWSD